MSFLTVCILCASFIGIKSQVASRPGGAGYALILNNNPLTKANFNNFPTNAFTFEAWISTYDSCNPGTLMSYALDTADGEEEIQRENLNHLIVSHIRGVIACHDYSRVYLTGARGAILAVAGLENCLQDYTNQQQDVETSIEFERNGTWTHLAVTLSTEDDGQMVIYKNGLIVGRLVSNKTRLLQPDGVFMLGGKQNCYGGCSPSREAFHGLIDEVRIWNVTRSQIQIQDYMTQTGQVLGNEKGLVAHWTFDDPIEESFGEELVARDLSGNGNDLELFSPPQLTEVQIEKDGRLFETGALIFERNYAMDKDFSTMPRMDITVEFWARLLVQPNDQGQTRNLTFVENRYYLMSYVTSPQKASSKDGMFGDGLICNALTIYIDLTEWNNSALIRAGNFSTRGSLWIGFGGEQSSWIEFDTKWLDSGWHHVAFTYESRTSDARLSFDGKESIPFWKHNGEGSIYFQPQNGGVGNNIPVESRAPRGSLVLGQYQDCFGGCFAQISSFSGMMANFRIWNRALSQKRIEDVMMKSMKFANPKGLVVEYHFDEETVIGREKTARYVMDRNGNAKLYLGSTMPRFEFSTAPLARVSGRPLDPPFAGSTGYALQLNDQKIVTLEKFKDFPTEALTIEFSMWSIDKCNSGVPFSYSVDVDGDHIDMLTLANYNDWIVVINGDFGDPNDPPSGVGSTDGLWHHVALTWDMKTGETFLYDNGKLHWKGLRSENESLVSGGTLVLGREQDCLGGCFDSASGAFQASPLSRFATIQDFFGLIDNVRIWNVVRSPSEIQQSLRFDLDLEEGRFNNYITSTSKGLIAWWKFDEGRGRRVQDSTTNRHNLLIKGTPSWVVSNRLEGCGDGILSQAEECDDGNRIDGDGCSMNCRLESTDHQPSVEEEEMAAMLDRAIEEDQRAMEDVGGVTSEVSEEMVDVEVEFDEDVDLLDDDIL